MKRPTINIHPTSCWATTGRALGLMPMRYGFSFVSDSDGMIDAPPAAPAGSAIKNIVWPDDRRRRPRHVIIPSLVFIRD